MTDINKTNNKCIAKNTIVLYLRMIFILCVGLFTSRVVLNTLGVVDYGLYNVVGGFVTIFTFLNGAMSTATQRFITFELAKGDIERQKATFSTAIIIHFVLAALIFLFAETVGMWMLYEKMVIPEGRFAAAMWVYQLSIASCMLSIVSLPYNAMIIAHEKMSAFAFISIMDVVLKLVIVYFLIITSFDRLIFYAVLLFGVQLLDRIIYGTYCSKHFVEAKFVFTFDKRIFKEMSNIAGWSLFGNLAGVGYTQGINLLLNIFFGPAINAARGVAVTVQGIVTGFVSNFQMALNPQITKTYAVNDLRRMHQLIFASSKVSFFLLLLIVLPVSIYADVILKLWLKNVPDHTVWFLRLTLCIMLVEALANPLMVSSQATGRVKIYQSVVGGTLLLIVPFSYIVLRMRGGPESVFCVHLLIAVIAQTFRIVIIGRYIYMSFGVYLKNVLLRVFLVLIVTSTLSVILSYSLPHTIISSLIAMGLIIMLTLGIIIMLGLSNHERTLVYSKVKLLVQSKFK